MLFLNVSAVFSRLSSVSEWWLQDWHDSVITIRSLMKAVRRWLKRLRKNLSPVNDLKYNIIIVIVNFFPRTRVCWLSLLPCCYTSSPLLSILYISFIQPNLMAFFLHHVFPYHLRSPPFIFINVIITIIVIFFMNFILIIILIIIISCN